MSEEGAKELPRALSVNGRRYGLGAVRSADLHKIQRDIQDYYARHRPEEAFDAKPYFDHEKGYAKAAGKKREPYPVMPKQYWVKESSKDYYDEVNVLDAHHVYTKEETEVYNKPPLHLDRQLDIYKITHVTSPTQFYMVKIAPIKSANGQDREFPDWWPQMQQFYDNLEEQLGFESVPVLSRVYVLWHTPTGSWERARILKVDMDERKCHIFFLDAGIFADAEWTSLKELSPKFAKPTPLVLSGKLQHVYPDPSKLNPNKVFNSVIAEEVEKPSKLWPAKAVTFMKTKAEGKYFYGIYIPDTAKYAISKTHEIQEISPEYKKFGMVLLDLTMQHSYTLNAELCLSGHAICTGMGASFECPDNPTTAGSPYQKNYIVNCGTNIFSMLGANESRPIFFSSEPRKAYPYKIENLEDFFTWQEYDCADKELGKGHLTNDRIPAVMRQHVNLCHLTTVISPSCFYVLPASHIPALKQATEYLTCQMTTRSLMWPNQRVSMMPYQISVGRPIVLWLELENDFFDSDGAWYRAVVKQVFTAQQSVMAILVDFGMEVHADMSAVHSMPAALENIPAFCFRAHLNIPNYAPYPSNIWSDSSIESFQSSFVDLYEQSPCHYVWESYPRNIVELDVFNQNMTFADDGSCTWKKFPFDYTSNTCQDIVDSDYTFELSSDEENADDDKLARDILISNGSGSQTQHPSLIAGFNQQHCAPFMRIHSPNFGKLCAPLFRSVGVNFSYEQQHAEDEKQTEYAFIHPVGLLLAGGHIRRQAKFNTKKFKPKLGENISLVRDQTVKFYPIPIQRGIIKG